MWVLWRPALLATSNLTHYVEIYLDRPVYLQSLAPGIFWKVVEWS